MNSVSALGEVLEITHVSPHHTSTHAGSIASNLPSPAVALDPEQPPTHATAVSAPAHEQVRESGMSPTRRAASNLITHKLKAFGTRSARRTARILEKCLTVPLGIGDVGSGPFMMHRPCHHRLCPHCNTKSMDSARSKLRQAALRLHQAGCQLVFATFTLSTQGKPAGKQWETLSAVWARFFNDTRWHRRRGLEWKSRFVEVEYKVDDNGHVHIHAIMAYRSWTPQLETTLKKRWRDSAKALGAVASFEHGLDCRLLRSEADVCRVANYVTKLPEYGTYSASLLDQIATGLKNVRRYAIGRLPSSMAQEGDDGAADSPASPEESTPPHKSDASGTDCSVSLEGRSAAILSQSEAHPESEHSFVGTRRKRSSTALEAMVGRLEGFVGDGASTTMTHTSVVGSDDYGNPRWNWSPESGCRDP